MRPHFCMLCSLQSRKRWYTFDWRNLLKKKKMPLRLVHRAAMTQTTAKIQDEVIPALLSTNPLEINDLEVLKSSLPFRSRGAILPVNYLDLFSWGVVSRDGDKDNPECNMGRAQQGKKTSPLKCQNLLEVEQICPPTCPFRATAFWNYKALSEARPDQ